MTDAPRPRPLRRPWDLALTVGLIALGAMNVATTFAANADLGPTLDEVYAAMGIEGRFQATETATAVGFVVNVIWVAALLWSSVTAIRRLREGRIAFWVPLLAGVVATLVLAIGSGVLVMGDPAFQEFVLAPSAPAP